MDAVLGIYAVLFLACLGLLLWVSRRHRQHYALAKGIQSGLFVAGALLAYLTGGRGHPQAFSLLLAALLLCACGDIALGVANQASHRKKDGGPQEGGKVGTAGVRKAPFLAGAGAFLSAHVVFCVLYFRITHLHPLCLILPVVCVVVILLFERFGAIRLGRLRPLGFVYPFLVGLMAAAALASAWTVGSGSPFALLTTVGSILFLLSDVVLVFLYFGATKHPFYRVANLTSYYLGVFLLAMSSHWF